MQASMLQLKILRDNSVFILKKGKGDEILDKKKENYYFVETLPPICCTKKYVVTDIYKDLYSITFTNLCFLYWVIVKI